MGDEEMLAMANGKDDDDCQAGGPGLSREEALKRYGVHVVLAALPHLTGDELRRVAEAMPRVAGEWTKVGNDWERLDGIEWAVAQVCGADEEDGEGWEAWTGGDRERVTVHPTARAAQAACDARLEAAGVRLCGEVVRG